MDTTTDKIIHGLLIDSIERTVKVVKIDQEDKLRSIQEHVGCKMIEEGVKCPNSDILYVAEQAEVKLEKRPKGQFKFNGQEFTGNGLVVNEKGLCQTAPLSPIVQMVRSIEFPPFTNTE